MKCKIHLSEEMNVLVGNTYFCPSCYPKEEEVLMIPTPFFDSPIVNPMALVND